MPRVTVIIATYNWSSVLRYSIASVLRQTFRDFELLVVGDGCTDDSEQVVAAFTDPRVRWIALPENTKHQSAPNNEGLRQARGELIAYLGHDDLWLPHHLQALVAAFDAQTADLAYSISIQVAADGAYAWPSIPRPQAGSFASPLSVMHRKRATDEIGGWRDYHDVRLSPDAELWQRMRAAGYAFVFVPRLTGIKFPASWRRNVYRTRPCHEQAAWTERIETEPDLESRQLVQFITGHPVPTGLPYRELVRHLLRQTAGRIRVRLSLPALWFRFRQQRTIDELRKFKGL